MKLFITLLISSFISLWSCSSETTERNKPVPTFKTGTYTHTAFHSKERGKVAFNVYLPPNWSKDNATEYPLMILMHGQGEDEFTFLQTLTDSSLNHWMNKGLLAEEFVIIALRGGKNTNEMQWYSKPNEAMITSNAPNELRAYAHKNFHTSMKSSQISVLGHSRGATGALNFALYFPDKFASVVSSAFVSDYAIERLKQASNQNLAAILASKMPIYMLIGSKDQYVLNNNRTGSPTMSAFFESKGIQHQFKVIENKSHRLSELWEYPTNLNCLQFCVQSWK